MIFNACYNFIEKSIERRLKRIFKSPYVLSFIQIRGYVVFFFSPYTGMYSK